MFIPELPTAVQEIQRRAHGPRDCNADPLSPAIADAAIPMHVCPTSALYGKVAVIENSHVAEYRMSVQSKDHHHKSIQDLKSIFNFPSTLRAASPRALRKWGFTSRKRLPGRFASASVLMLNPSIEKRYK
ncbi:MAG: hypothetical protein U0936_04440 [Planctomycetaceae bacterium]